MDEMVRIMSQKSPVNSIPKVKENVEVAEVLVNDLLASPDTSQEKLVEKDQETFE